jgi:hypothetical protein
LKETERNLPTSKMLADLLTKPLQVTLFNTLRAAILGKVDEVF